MDKNTDLKNYKAPKHDEKLESFTICFVAIIIMIALAALKQSWDEGMARLADEELIIKTSCYQDHN